MKLVISTLRHEYKREGHHLLSSNNSFKILDAVSTWPMIDLLMTEPYF